MNPVKFCKLHGFGNDYIVIEAENIRHVEDIGDFARKMCDRHTGVGSDGIALLERLDGEAADYSCRIINPDGSEGSFSGNGTRCAVAYLYFNGQWQGEKLRLRTLSGVKNYQLLEKDELTCWFLAEIGKPKFAPEEIPFVAGEPLKSVTHYELRFENYSLPVTALNVGNPAAVIFVESFEAVQWRKIGRELESHPQFPERTNVVFVRVVDAENIEIRIWERGAAETSSSGTCSIAAAVASAFTGKTGRQVSVHAPGGTTEAVWRDDGEMLITGRADLVCRGEYLTEIR